MELLIWLFIALGILILSAIVLVRGVSQRVSKPNAELEDRVSDLEKK